MVRGSDDMRLSVPEGLRSESQALVPVRLGGDGGSLVLPGEIALGQITAFCIELKFDPEAVCALERVARAVERVAVTAERMCQTHERVATHCAPAPSDIVGSEYVAEQAGWTTTWVAEQAREGEIPKNCIVAGSGNGKPWKFHRAQIDKWLASR